MLGKVGQNLYVFYFETRVMTSVAAGVGKGVKFMMR